MAGDTRFRPEYRLHHAEEFSAVFSYRKVIRGAYFDLHWCPRSALKPDVAGDSADVQQDGSSSRSELLQSGPRLGLVVAKRLARRAVLRNRIKRLAREVFRHSRAELPAFDLVLKLGRKPVLPEDKSTWNAVLREDIENVIKRLLQLAARQTP